MKNIKSLSAEDFLLFQEFLVAETGLYFDNANDHFLREALYERMLAKGYASYLEYYNFLRYHLKGRQELRFLLARITTGETFFFRHSAQFSVLTNDLLPELIRKKMNTPGRSIKIWSAGCSRGNEAYSIAIGLMETLADYRDWAISILGTDINRDVLAAAQEAIYSQRDMGELPPAYVVKYFKEKWGKYTLIPEVKDLVRFEYHNLAGDAFGLDGMRDADIIFCRNVTIYFNHDTTQRLIHNFYDCLGEGGYLLLGHAETLWQIDHAFRTIEYPNTFIYQKLSHAAEPSKDVKPFIDMPTHVAPEPLAGTAATPVEAPAVSAGRADDMSRAAVLVNAEKYDEAAVLLAAMVKKDPLNAQATFFLATVQYKIGKFQEAERLFRQVIYLAPDSALAYFNLGNIYIARHNPAKAALEFGNALRLLEGRPPDESVRFCEDFTSGFLRQACQHHLGSLHRRVS